jgi:hypothetical protein
MREVMLETSNPPDIGPEELRDLADELGAQVDDVDFVVGYFDQHGARVTWHEVLHT